LERIGKPKNFLLLKAIYNRIKVITTINYGKQTLKLNTSKNGSIAVDFCIIEIRCFDTSPHLLIYNDKQHKYYRITSPGLAQLENGKAKIIVL